MGVESSVGDLLKTYWSLSRITIIKINCLLEMFGNDELSGSIRFSFALPCIVA